MLLRLLLSLDLDLSTFRKGYDLGWWRYSVAHWSVARPCQSHRKEGDLNRLLPIILVPELGWKRVKEQ